MKTLKLKAARVEKGFIQSKLAEHLGITEATYNRKELGLKNFSIAEIKKLSALLDLSLDQIDEIFFDQELTIRKVDVKQVAAI